MSASENVHPKGIGTVQATTVAVDTDTTAASCTRTYTPAREPYIYKPLEASKTAPDNTRLQHQENEQIRIFVLSAGSGQEPLRGTLVTSHVSSAPSYEAISYVWGDPTMSAEVICDERALKVTESAGTVLRRFRLPNQQRRLWIDGISINQGDLTERGHQVKLMKAVYSNAEEVLVWLGDGGQMSAIAVKILEGLASQFEPAEPPIELADLERIFSSVTDLPQAITAVENLLQCSWAQRLWVVQELALASSVRFFYGSCMFSKMTIIAGVVELQKLYQMRSENISLTALMAPWDNILDLASTRWTWLWIIVPGAEPLIRHRMGYLLCRTSSQLCSEILDRLFAILGLVDPLFVMTLSVDYDSHPTTVLRAFTLAEIQCSKTLDILADRNPLSWLSREPTESRGASWLFDWLNCVPHILPLRTSNEAYFKGLVEQAPRLQVSECGTAISLEGRVVDNISNLSLSPKAPAAHKPSLAELEAIIVSILLMVLDCDGDGVEHAMRISGSYEHFLRILYASPYIYQNAQPTVASTEDRDALHQCQAALLNILYKEEWSINEEYR
ncbi:hypothetical protein LTR96_006316 [Exophiala xenobiotica]|nr:hypothetical protein LTR96_006316 [Exophiala xenobiotica]KAK5336803.1 hypothetical protein LTR98_007109 [Exophiala xenobiotica]